MKILETLKELLNYLRRNKIILVLVMFFAFVYLINYDLFLFKITKNLKDKNLTIMKIDKRISVIKKKYSSLKIERQNFVNIEASIKNLKLKIKKGQIRLPKTFKISKLISQLSESAPKFNFIIEKISFGKAIVKKPIKILPVSISFISGFNEALLFIKNINSLNRIFLLNGININVYKKHASNLQITINGDVFAMGYKPNKNIVNKNKEIKN